ncbi:MAG: BtpA/SgcQ family protein [Candidatus Heimdallarchaeota archaeon]|nr:BtpA/SgcQ family protein [Candidatus Heimdallarchaeota archaeon]
MGLFQTNLKQFQQIFGGVHKPIIGMIHLAALPSSPNHLLSLDAIISQAKKELHSLQSGGVDGVLIENFNDSPFFPSSVEPITIASMSIIIKELVSQSSVPVGVNVLRNACQEALAIATATGADFIRCNFYTGAFVADQGIIEGCAPWLKRLQKRYSEYPNFKSVKIFADVNCKHATPLVSQPLEHSAFDALERGQADAIIITGKRTGMAAKVSDLKLLRSKGLQPIILGSGVNQQNIDQLLPYADGAIIGTALKEDGKVTNLVDKTRVSALMEKVIQLRKG